MGDASGSAQPSSTLLHCLPMSVALPWAQPRQGVLLVLALLLLTPGPADGAGSPFDFGAFDKDKNGKLEPIEFVKVSAAAACSLSFAA